MWIELLLGHLVGDYLLQTKWMAVNKSKNTLIGWFAATVHCLIYTLAVGVLMQEFDVMWLVLVFFSHFFIDKFSLGEVYMYYIKGYGLKDYVNEYHPKGHVNSLDVLKGSFTALIYTVTDNTMHLLLMYYGYDLIFNYVITFNVPWM